MKSISARLNAVFVGIVTLILLISGGINYFTAKADLDERLAEQAAALSARLKINVPELLWNFDEGQIDKVIEAEMVDVDITGILVSVKGKVVSGRVRDADGKITPAGDGVKLTGESQKLAMEYNDSGTMKPMGDAEFALSTARRDAALNGLLVKIVIQVIVLNAILMAVLATSLRTLVFRPLARVTDALRQIASGEADLTRSLSTAGSDELSAIASHFNAFTLRLRQVITESLGAAGEQLCHRLACLQDLRACCSVGLPQLWPGRQPQPAKSGGHHVLLLAGLHGAKRQVGGACQGQRFQIHRRAVEQLGRNVHRVHHAQAVVLKHHMHRPRQRHRPQAVHECTRLQQPNQAEVEYFFAP